MATLPPKSQKKDSGLTKMGNVPVEVKAFDVKTNTIEGTNLRSGEDIAVRLATVDEISNFYVPRTTFPTQDARDRRANESIANRPDVRTLNSKTSPGLVGQTVQLQGAMKKPDGNVIARWAKAVTADLELDVALRGEVEFIKVQTKEDEWRRANVVQPRQSEPVTFESLDRSLQNAAVGPDGRVAEGSVQSRPLAVMQDTNDEIESSFLYSPKIGKGEDSQQLFGADGADGAFQNIKLTENNHRVMAAVAGRVDIAGKDLNGYDALPPDEKEAFDIIHDMSSKGEIEVAITPGFSSNLLPNRSKAVIASESSKKGAGPLTGRGYFEADVSLRTYQNDDDNSPVDARMKEAVETGFMHHPQNDQFVKRDRDAVAANAIQHARDNSGGMEKLMEPAPSVQAQMQAQAGQEAQMKQQKEAALGAPAISG